MRSNDSAAAFRVFLRPQGVEIGNFFFYLMFLFFNLNEG
jgi:hypothetical protein